MAHTTDVDQNFTEEPKDQCPTIGNKYFILSPGNTIKPKEDIIKKLIPQMPGQLVQTVEECNIILVLCFIVSRTGTDIDAALNELNSLSESKPAVFIVLYHTFEPEKIVPDSSSYVSRENTLTVDCLFHEDQGLLKCVKNEAAQTRIYLWLQTQTPMLQLEQTSGTSTLQTNTPWFRYPFNPSTTEVDPEISKVSSYKSGLKLVLLGMSALEKTEVEHLIFGRKDSLCESSPAPLKKITVDTGEVDGERVAVINTHDWLSSWLPTEDIKQKIQFCINLSSNGPYALLLVIPPMLCLKEKIEMVKKFETVLEKSWWEKVIILFTVKDEKQKQDIQDSDLQTKLRKEFHVLNISDTEDRSQVSKLLKKVKKTVAGNGEKGGCPLS